LYRPVETCHLEHRQPLIFFVISLLIFGRFQQAHDMSNNDGLTTEELAKLNGLEPESILTIKTVTVLFCDCFDNLLSGLTKKRYGAIFS
jgi:hypothetical protein